MTEKSKTMLLLVLATVAGMSLWFMTAAILPEIVAEAGISATQAAYLSSAVQGGFVFGALVIAFTGLADRVDPRFIFVVCSVGTAVVSLGLLVVPLDGVLAVFLRFLTGALIAGVYPIAMKIAFGWGLKDRGLLTGLLVGALTLGNSIPYGLAWIGGADWRLTLSVTSAIAILGGLLVLATKLGPSHARAAQFRPSAIMIAWTDRRIRAAYAGYLCHMWELFALWAWVGVASTASYALTIDEESSISLGKLTAFVTVAAGAPACVLAGRFADRLGKGKIASWAMVLSALFAILTALSFGGPVAITFMLFLFWGITVIPDSAQFSALVADYAPPEVAGSLMTFQTALGFLLTVVTVQLTPMIAAALGWPIMLGILSIGPILGVYVMRPLAK